MKYKKPDGTIEFGGSSCTCCNLNTPRRGGKHTNSSSSWIKVTHENEWHSTCWVRTSMFTVSRGSMRTYADAAESVAEFNEAMAQEMRRHLWSMMEHEVYDMFLCYRNEHEYNNECQPDELWLHPVLYRFMINFCSNLTGDIATEDDLHKHGKKVTLHGVPVVEQPASCLYPLPFQYINIPF